MTSFGPISSLPISSLPDELPRLGITTWTPAMGAPYHIPGQHSQSPSDLILTTLNRPFQNQPALPVRSAARLGTALQGFLDPGTLAQSIAIPAFWSPRPSPRLPQHRPGQAQQFDPDRLGHSAIFPPIINLYPLPRGPRVLPPPPDLDLLTTTLAAALGAKPVLNTYQRIPTLPKLAGRQPEPRYPLPEPIADTPFKFQPQPRLMGKVNLADDQNRQGGLGPDTIGRGNVQPPFLATQTLISLPRIPSAAQQGLDPDKLGRSNVQPPANAPQQTSGISRALPQLPPQTAPPEPGAAPFTPINYRTPALPAFQVQQATLDLLATTLLIPVGDQQTPLTFRVTYQYPTLPANLLPLYPTPPLPLIAFQAWTLPTRPLLQPPGQMQGIPFPLFIEETRPGGGGDEDDQGDDNDDQGHHKKKRRKGRTPLTTDDPYLRALAQATGQILLNEVARNVLARAAYRRLIDQDDELVALLAAMPLATQRNPSPTELDDETILLLTTI